jgi:hypothetical protein
LLIESNFLVESCKPFWLINDKSIFLTDESAFEIIMLSESMFSLNWALLLYSVVKLEMIESRIKKQARAIDIFIFNEICFEVSLSWKKESMVIIEATIAIAIFKYAEFIFKFTVLLAILLPRMFVLFRLATVPQKTSRRRSCCVLAKKQSKAPTTRIE